MNKRTLPIIIVVLALIGGGVFMWKKRGGDEPKNKPDIGNKTPAAKAPKTKRMRAKTPAQAQPAMPPRVSVDDDPEGNLRLEGQVMDDKDAPVGGALVSISSNPLRTTKTEKDGSFHFDKLVGRTYSVWARKDGLVGGPVRHKLTANSDPVAVRLKAGAKVEVTVVNAQDQKPIQGATVLLRSMGDQTEISDDKGVARFDGVSGGFFAVVATAKDFAPARRAVQVPPSPKMAVKVQLALRRGAPVSGVVVDEKGAPVVGARVMARDTSALYSLQDARTEGAVTDKKGRFLIPAVASGTYRVVASKDAYLTSAAKTPITIKDTNPVKDIKVVLRTGGTISGVVQDSAEQPVPWATIRVAADQRNAFDAGGGVRQVTADDRGAFTVRGLPRDQLSVFASSDTASSEVVPADLKKSAEVKNLILTLDVEGEISGTVVDGNGDPVAEAQVNAMPDFFSGTPVKNFALRGMQAQTTDGGGRFRFRGVPPGTFRLRASRTTMTAAEYLQPGVQAATGDKDVKITLLEKGRIKGTVQFKDGTAPKVFSVAVGFPPGTPVSDKRGEFEIPDVPPGTHDVTIRGPDFSDVVVSDVTIKPGETTDLKNITVKKGRDVSGRVVDATGTPVADAQVIVATRLIGDGKTVAANLGTGAEQALGLRRSTSDESGMFRVRGIGDTELVIVAEHPDRGRSVPQLIPAGPLPPHYELGLRAFGKVIGTVRAGGSPAAKVTVIATPAGTGQQSIAVNTAADGTYVIEKLPEGEHNLTAMLGAGGGTGATSGGADVTVKAGSEVKADIDIEVGTIKVAVVITPKPGAKVDAAQVFLIKGAVKSKSGKELQQAFLAAGKSGGARMAFATGKPLQAKFDKVTSGRYSVCIVPITGNISDPSCGARIQKAAFELAVHCSSHEVASDKSEATINLKSPSMSPNVCEKPDPK